MGQVNRITETYLVPDESITTLHIDEVVKSWEIHISSQVMKSCISLMNMEQFMEVKTIQSTAVELFKNNTITEGTD